MSAANPPSDAAKPKKRSGRPRRLTIEQVLDAGQSLGLDNLTMAAVAEKLGVRITVLYGYVANKEELFRLVALRASRAVEFPRDEGQDWPYYAMQHGQSLYALLTSNGQLLSHYLAGGLGPELEMDRMESWLEFMTSRGFSADGALRLYRQLGEIVVGGVTTHLHLAALSRSGTSYAQAAERARVKRGAGQVPHLTSIYSDFTDHAPVWRDSLLLLFKQVSAERGEGKSADYWQALHRDSVQGAGGAAKEQEEAR